MIMPKPEETPTEHWYVHVPQTSRKDKGKNKTWIYLELDTHQETSQLFKTEMSRICC